MRTRSRTSVWALLAAIVACGCEKDVLLAWQGGTGGAGGAASSSASTSAHGSGGSGGAVTSGSTGSGAGGSGGAAAGGGAPAQVYASTSKELYTSSLPAPVIDMKLVGVFDCIGGSGQDPAMTGIAVDDTGTLWGVSAHSAYALQVQGSTVHCARTIPLQGVPGMFAALSFAPKGILDPAMDALLAGTAVGDLWKVDTTTGALELHGDLGVVPAADPQGNAYPSDPAATGATTTVGTAWQLSGGLAFGVAAGAPFAFAAVRDCTSTGCSGTDTLVAIDTAKLALAGTQDAAIGARGQMRRRAGCSDAAHAAYGGVAGLVAGGAALYGFSRNGYVVAIGAADGTACLVDGMNTTQGWTGAALAPP
jgi:hypothetical protein